MCPDCHVPLPTRFLCGVEVQACPRCLGVLVARPRLVPLLEATGRALLAGVDAEQRALPAPARPGPPPCPACSASMEPFAYLGDGAVTLDRCAACDLVWLDPGEVADAALLLDETHRRVDAHAARRGAETAEMSGRMDRMRWNAKMADRIALLLI